MHDWDAFDRELAESLTDLPLPERTVAAVTPWREALDRIVLGLCLTCFTLNFLYLQYLLPAVGAAALYLGFRSLRTAGPWFRLGWAAATCKVIILYCNFLLAATPLSGQLPDLHGLLGSGLTFLLFLSLWRGLRQAAAALGQRPKKAPALWACLWYLALIALALFLPQPGWPVFLVLVFAFYRIVKALLRVPEELEGWGYAVAAAPVRVSAQRWQTWYFASLAGLLLLAAAAGCHRPLRGTALEQNFDSPETAALRAELADLGFPETWSARLLPEDLASLSETVRFGNNFTELSCYGSDPSPAYDSTVFVFQLSDGSVRFLHFFSTDEAGGFWRCGLSLRAEAGLSDITCRLFYRRSGQMMTAPLEPLNIEETSGIGYFGDPFQWYTAAFPPFSWPLGSQERGGYVLFTADQAANPKTVLDEQLFYGRDELPRYPLPAPGDYHNTWHYGAHAYFGDGSGLVYKADQGSP